MIGFNQRNTLIVEPSTQRICSTNIVTDGIPREAPLFQSTHKARQIWSDRARLQANEHIRPLKITFNHLPLLLLRPDQLTGIFRAKRLCASDSIGFAIDTNRPLGIFRNSEYPPKFTSGLNSNKGTKSDMGVWATPFAPRTLSAGGAPGYRADSSGEFLELQNCRKSLKNRML